MSSGKKADSGDIWSGRWSGKINQRFKPQRKKSFIFIVIYVLLLIALIKLLLSSFSMKTDHQTIMSKKYGLCYIYCCFKAEAGALWVRRLCIPVVSGQMPKYEVPGDASQKSSVFCSVLIHGLQRGGKASELAWLLISI